MGKTIKEIEMPIPLIASLAAYYGCDEIFIPFLESGEIDINSDEGLRFYIFTHGKLPYKNRQPCVNDSEAYQDTIDEDLTDLDNDAMDEEIDMPIFNTKYYHLVVVSGNLDFVKKILKFDTSGEDDIWLSVIDHAKYSSIKDKEEKIEYIIEILKILSKWGNFNFRNFSNDLFFSLDSTIRDNLIKYQQLPDDFIKIFLFDLFIYYTCEFF